MTKLISRSLLSMAAIIVSTILFAQNELYISAVMDGSLPLGLPKAIKLCANSDIDDLSLYGIASVNNGGGSTGQEFALSGSLAAGDCIWIGSEEVGFADFFGCPPDFVTGAANVNGDDAIEVYKSEAVVDLFGDPNMDGTDQCWEYLDGYVVRNVSQPNGGVFDFTCSTNEWTYSGINALDGVLTYSAVVPSEPFGPFDTDCGGGLYYESIDTSILSCAQLKTALHNLIDGQTNLPYGPSLGYDVIDFICDYDYLDGAVLDRYAGTSYTDCTGDRYTSGTNATATGQGWNRDHIFPRSWWGGGESTAQFVDLHNIYPSDAYFNSLKSNFPLGKAIFGFTSESVLGTDVIGCAQGCNDQVFEPADQYKGDFARAYLYMAIRYEDEMSTWETTNCVGDAMLTGESYMVYENCLLSRLLFWHQNDPVDDIELARNEGIFQTQGNRNPLIDNPAWSELIWGVSNGSVITAPECDPNACALPEWEVVEITSNGSFSNGGQWTEDGTGYTANAYCGNGCQEAAESWLVYGPLDLTSTSTFSLEFNATEQFGETFLDFLWTGNYTGCPVDAENDWSLAATLLPTDLPSEGTPHAQSIDYGAASGTEGYIAIRYADDGVDGYSRWELDQFSITADECPSVGQAIVSSCATCPEDITGDGIIDIADFLEFNSSFGQQCDCPADINGDGIVDVLDFIQLNSVFGQLCD